MKIGKLANRSGCTIQSIRFYERENLLPSPRRSEGNFRLYDLPTLEQLLFIKRCRSLNLTLEEIRELLEFKEGPDVSCNDINTIIDKHIAEVVTRISEMQNLQHQLKTLRRSCSSRRNMSHCGILQCLSQSASGSS